MNLRLVTEDTNTLTLGWDPVDGVTGYRFTSTEFPGKHPHTWDAERNTVKFHKGPDGTVYTVEAIDVADSGQYPQTAPPPPPPPPPPTNGTITPAQFKSRAVSGATLENLTVTGGVSLNTQNVTVKGCTIQGDFEFQAGSSGSQLLDSSADALFIWGADNILAEGNVFDGKNKTLGGKMWDSGGNPPKNIVIRGNTFKNQNTGNDADHSQAMFVGYSDGVLIEGNTFVNNGSTSDIFFSWWGDLNPSETKTYPRNVCVRGNTFSDPNDLHYFAINFRAEIKTSANIKTDPAQQGFSTTSPEFNGTCSG